jgi:ATP-dependent Clp protease ATP-binding subunit ClpA
MFERFTDRARKIMALANHEAMQFHHEYIGTEHILLGLVKAGSGVGANALKNLGVDLRGVRLEVERLIKVGPDMVTVGKLPQTPRCKRVIELAIEESRSLRHDYVGSEHLLLGLLREQEGVAGTVLRIMGLQIEQVRDEVVRFLERGIERPEFIELTGYITLELQRAEYQARKVTRELGHRSISTGHFLLGLLEEPQGLAARLLTKLGVTAEMVREEVVKCGGREAEG